MLKQNRRLKHFRNQIMLFTTQVSGGPRCVQNKQVKMHTLPKFCKIFFIFCKILQEERYLLQGKFLVNQRSFLLVLLRTSDTVFCIKFNLIATRLQLENFNFKFHGITFAVISVISILSERVSSIQPQIKLGLVQGTLLHRAFRLYLI